MQIFIHIEDNPELDDIAGELVAAIATWVAGCNCTARVVDEGLSDSGARTVGLVIDTGKRAMLKPAVDFMYRLASSHEQECVVGYVDADSGAAHKVCYFGHEEGRPDIGEIGSYLGLRR